MAHILISRTCVNNCIFCTVATRRKNMIFPEEEEIIRFIRECAKSKVNYLVFSGMGEPTLDPNFEKYLDFASQFNFQQISLFTNGYGLTEDKVLHWKNKGINRVLLSMHGFKESHDCNVQRKGSFDEAVNALILFSRNGILVSINTCMTRSNLADITKLREFLKDYPIYMQTLSFPEWSGNVFHHQQQILDYEEVANIADELIPDDDKITYFEGMPYCLVRKKTLEMRGQNLISLLDGTGEKEIDSLQSKIFPETCYLKKCPFQQFCSGFEKDYIRIRGWQNLLHNINLFLDEIDRPEFREKIISSGIINPAQRESMTVDKIRSYDKTGEGLTVIVKPTTRCNAGCRYCASHRNSHKPDMSIDLLSKMSEEIIDYAISVNKKYLTFLWHGGEPLLLGKSFYQDAWNYTDNRNKVRIRHIIQTNLLLLDDEWAKLLKQYDVHISSSIDPVGNDRILKDGTPQYPLWIEKFILACSYNLHSGIVFTVTSQHLNKAPEIYQFFKNLQSITSRGVSIRINPVYPAGAALELDSQDLIEPVSFGRFLHQIYGMWIKDGMPFVLLPFKNWIDGEGLSCEFSGNCSEGFVSIDNVGDVYNCGRFSDTGISWGNIGTAKLAEILKNPQNVEIANRKDILEKNQCSGCEYWDLCKGGCPCQAYLVSGNINEKTPFCSGYSYFFSKSGIAEKFFKKRNIQP